MLVIIALLKKELDFSLENENSGDGNHVMIAMFTEGIEGECSGIVDVYERFYKWARWFVLIHTLPYLDVVLMVALDATDSISGSVWVGRW